MHLPSLMSVSNERGSATLLAVIFLSVLLTLTVALGSIIGRAYSMSGKGCLRAKAFHIAEGGLHKAMWKLSRSPADYAGEKETLLGEGAFTVEVSSLEGEPGRRIITSSGRASDERSPRVKLKAVVRLRPSESGNASVVVEHWELAK